MSYWTRWRVFKNTDSDAARQSRQAQEFVNDLPDDPNKPGYKQNPTPVYAGTIGPVDRTQYKVVPKVNVADLRTRQPYIEAKRVANFDRSKLPKDDTAHPLVIKTRDNQLVVDNGNHRVAHMHAIGMKHTPVRMIHELDGYGKDRNLGSVP